jgi:predicted CopG family antitoxin
MFAYWDGVERMPPISIGGGMVGAFIRKESYINYNKCIIDMVVDMKTITIQLESEIVEKLEALGRKGESYGDIIQRLIEKVNYEVFMREQYKILDKEDEWVLIDEL